MRLEFKKDQIINFFLCLMANIGLFQCDPWCLPTQNWLKNATNDISIYELYYVIRHGCMIWFTNKRLFGIKTDKVLPMCEIYQIFPGFREQKDSIVFGQYHRKTTTVTLFAGKQLSSDFTNFLTASATSKRLHWPQNIVHSQPSSVLVIHSDSSRIIPQIF